MEKTTLHNDSLLYASLIAILLLISYWFTTRCFKIISGIEGTGLGTWWGQGDTGPFCPLPQTGQQGKLGAWRGKEGWGPFLCDTLISSSVTLFVPPSPGLAPLRVRAASGSHSQDAGVPRAALGDPAPLCCWYLGTAAPHCGMGMQMGSLVPPAVWG